jgi:hypothetical protein
MWLDRDINAAVNVAKAAGLAAAACGAQVRPRLNLAQRGEAGTHPKPRPENGVTDGNPRPSGWDGSQHFGKFVTEHLARPG